MNSLLAALLKWRIFILTIGVSGVVHLALIGGWLAAWEAPHLSGQEGLTISVTAPAADASVEAVVPTGVEKSSLAAAKPASITADNDVSASFTVAPVPNRAPKPVSPQGADSTLADDVPSKPKQSKALEDRVLAAGLATKALETEAIEHTDATSPRREKPLTQKKVTQVSPQSASLTEKTITEPPISEPSVSERRSPAVASTAVTGAPPQSLTSSGMPLLQSQPAFRTPPQPPIYPRLARKRGIEGRVMLQVMIDRNGRVTGQQVERSSGSELLDRAAQKAVQYWQFVPAQQHGMAVASYVRVPIDFVMEKHK